MSADLHPRFDQGAAPAAGAPSGAIDPADANRCWEWVQAMGKIGFTVAVVEIKYDPKALEQFGPPEVLAAQLISEELGHWDSIGLGAPFKLYFYLVTKTIPAGLQFIKERLTALGLLGDCKIGHADAKDRCWRTFYPDLEKALSA
jgi:hypothetical protein